jgi:hypothetical protein
MTTVPITTPSRRVRRVLNAAVRLAVTLFSAAAVAGLYWIVLTRGNTR